jgi:dihydroorotate dehydrogenase/Pyruvate/2-oxoacid:ferredoxin oxidoreductase delta subunit
VKAVDISIDLLGQKLQSPIVAASGPPSMDLGSVRALADAGIGAVITKTILREPSINPRPCLYRGQRFFLNTERCSTKPLNEWLQSDLPGMAALSIPIIASIGMTPEEAEQLAGPVVEAGADILELSIFTPVDDPSPMEEAIRRVRAQVDVPILCKLSCNVSDVVGFARSFQQAGADGVSAIDALKAAMVLDRSTGRPVMLEQGFARMSGEALFPVALFHISQVAHYTDLVVVGTGGVSTGQDAVDMTSCGALGVGVCTTLIVEGPEAVERINSELREELQNLGVPNLESLRGRTLRQIDFTDEEEERQEYEKRAWDSLELVAHIDSQTCVACGRCASVCPYYAAAGPTDGAYHVTPEACEGCGLCVSVCPVTAIELIEVHT